MRVDVEGVRFAYEQDSSSPTLDGIDLKVASGELVALIGPNGSGKSTLLRLISGVLRPARGRIRLGDDDVSGLPAREMARRLAMVSQDRPVGFEFTVREIVAMGRTPYRGRFRAETRADRRAIDEALALTDIGGLADRSIREISGGERQRVFLALALAQEPNVLLLDEPTTHLDLGHQLRFLSIVLDRTETGCTVLLAIHDLGIAAQTASRVALLVDGKLQACAPPGQVLTPEHLERAFRTRLRVGRDAGSGSPYVVPEIARSRPDRASDGVLR